MKIRHPNRKNKIVDRHSSGCALCKPHKHGHAHRFKDKDVLRAKAVEEDIRDDLPKGEA